MGLGRQCDRQIRRSFCAFSAPAAADGRADSRLDRDQPVAGYPGRRRNRGNRRCCADRRLATGCLSRQGIRCMAKASFALALWLCTSLSVLAATPQKKPPTWGELTQEQQQTLAPLAEDWNNLEPERKRKWIGIAKRYPKMKPDEQARVQRRMQAWAKLTPKERQEARERYKRIKNLPPDKKEGLKQKWEEYNRLPEQERRKLGSTPRKPSTAAPAAPAEAPAVPPSAPAAPADAAAGPGTAPAPAATQ